MNARGGLSRRRPLAAASAYAVATFFSFPQRLPGVEHALDFGLLASPLAVTCLLLALEGLPRRRAVRVAFLASLVAHACFFYWFVVATVVYGGVHPALGVLTPIVPGVFVACFTAAFAWAFVRLRERGWTSPFATAALYTAADFARGRLLGGFPWASLGYAQWRNEWLLGLAPLAGVHALVFSVALAGAGLATAVEDRRLSRRSAAALAGVLVLHLVGAFRAADPAPRETAEIRVAALQGNIDQREKWSEARVGRNLATYLALARRAAAAGAKIVVWPESAVPGFVELDPSIREPIATLARELQVTFVLGGTGAVYDPARRTFDAFFDSAFVMGPSGRLLDRYDKTHLVPFGEFVPLRPLLGLFLEALARGMASVDASAGEAPRAVDVPVPGGARTVRAGVPICYELIFPRLVRRMAGDGAQVLFGITNDAWYGRTGARDQFLAMSALRAAETARPLLRAANSGISALVDARGRVVQRSDLDVQDVLVGDIPLLPEAGGETLYVRWGDVFAWACVAGAGGLLAWPARRRSRAMSRAGPQVSQSRGDESS